MPPSSEDEASTPFGAPRAVGRSATFFVVMNAGSGHDDTAEAREIIERTLRDGGRELRMALVDDPAKLAEVSRDTVREAQATGGVVVVAGGDGTINCVANAVYGSGCNFAVIPQGTFNFFGRTHGVSQDTATAAAHLLTARAHPVQVGLVNDRVFLVNASLGLYPQVLQDREAFKQTLGRHRWVGLLAALNTLLRDRGELRLDVEHAGDTRTVRTRTLFIANNALQLEKVGIAEAPLLDSSRLVGLMLRPVSTPKLLWLLARGAFGKLGEADQVISFAFGRIAVEPHNDGRRMKVATDGEILWLEPPLEFKVGPEPLYLLKPEPDTTESERA